MNEELLKAIEGSNKSYKEILDFIQGKEKRGEQAWTNTLEL